MKNKDKKKEKRGRIALTRQYPLLFPQVQCISFAPETELQGGGMRRKRKEKSEREDAKGKKNKYEKYILMRQCLN